MTQRRISQPSNVHIDKALSDFTIGFMQDLDRFVATRLFPEVGVDKKSDSYYIWTRDFWHRAVMGRKVAGGHAPRMGLGLDQATYTAEGFWLEYQLDGDVVANEDEAVDQEQGATRWLTYQAVMNREVKFAADHFKTTVWGTDRTLAGPDQWDDFAASDPIGDIKTAKQAVEKGTTMPPNVLTVGPEVWDNGLADHPLFLDRYKFTQTGIMTPQLVAAVLDLDDLLVARAVRNTAVEKAEATESYTGTYIFGKHALLMNIVPGTGRLQPAAGKTFHWRPNVATMQIERYPDDRADAEILRIRDYFDQKITSKHHGYFFENAAS